MRAKFAAAFAEWQRRYQAKPAQFSCGDTPEEYGQAAAEYFCRLLKDLEPKPAPRQLGRIDFEGPRYSDR